MLSADIPAQIRECVDGGAAPVSVAEITSRATAADRAFSHRPFKRGAWLGLSATGLAAAGIAAGLIVSQVGGGAVNTGHADVNQATLDAATLNHIASASRSAMATSGRALVSYQTTGDPSDDQAGSEDITFDGRNWSNSFTYTTQGASTERAINEVVGGQAYDFFPIYTPTPQWVHDTGPDAVQSLNLPDPRTLLDVLSPGAGFEADGYTTVGGIRVEHLRATTPGNVSLAMLGQLAQVAQEGSRVAALDLWVDASGVVRQATFTVTGTEKVMTLTWGQRGKAKFRVIEPASQRATTRNPGAVHVHTVTTVVSVEFRQIGQPQHITTPTSFVTVDGKG
jgi:hypothetical protein